MKNLIIRQLSFGHHKVFTYVAVCPVTKAAVIIDPGVRREGRRDV